MGLKKAKENENEKKNEVREAKSGFSKEIARNRGKKGRGVLGRWLGSWRDGDREREGRKYIGKRKMKERKKNTKDKG